MLHFNYALELRNEVRNDNKHRVLSNLSSAS